MQPFKCAPQILGMQRHASKKATKATHRATSSSGLACEAAPLERASISETLDRSKTHLNVSEGPDSGEELWRRMCDEADGYRQPVMNRDGTPKLDAHGNPVTRALRKDAVIGYAVVDHPPVEVTRDWDVDTMRRFSEDSDACMNEVLKSLGRPPIFGGDNARATYYHLDEGRVDPLDDSTVPLGIHAHKFGMARDPETGRYCGNYIDGRFLHELNVRYPALMRERGWPLEDLDVVDWERYSSDEAYRRERAARRRATGLSANEYHRRQAERASHARMREAADQLDDTLATLHRTKAAVSDLDDASEELRRQNERLAAEAERSRAQAAAADEAARAATAARERAERERDEARDELRVVRECVRRLGPDGPGIKWDYEDGHSTHEKSIREVREERDAEVEAAKAAQAQAEQARAQAERERDAAIEARRQADAGRDEAVKERDAATRACKRAKSERDKAASQLQAIRDDVSALGPDGYGIDWEDGHEQSLRDVREDVAAARDELVDAKGKLTATYQDIDQARDDLGVATNRGTLRLRDVVASVIGVVAGAVDDLGAHKVAAWLRDMADRLTDKAIDEIAPETVRAHRALADMPDGLDAASTGVDCARSAGPDA